MTPIRKQDQFAAIAYLRWRLFVNGLRRKGSTSELVARILLYPIVAALALLPIVGCGLGAWFSFAYKSPEILTLIPWVVLGLSIVLSINLAPPALAFDPASLIRFPLSFPTYLTTRLFLGVLTASTVISSLSLASAAIGVGIARPHLFLIAAVSFGLYALALIVVTRMAFVWVDRWLATRVGRSVFTGAMFAFGLTAQFTNFYFTADHTHTRLRHLAQQVHLLRQLPALTAFFHNVYALSNLLPPGLAATAIHNTAHGTVLDAIPPILGILAFTALCLAIFATRMKKEFRGELIAEGTFEPGTNPGAPFIATSHRDEWVSTNPQTFPPAPRDQILLTCLQKELLYLRRSGPLVFLLLLPLSLVYFMAVHMGDTAWMIPWVYPAAAAYSLLNISAASYNSFGPDLGGVQMYFLAPIRISDVLLAKNLITFLTLTVQIVLTWVIVSVALRVPTAATTITTILWFIFTITINTAIGNSRSISAPKRVELGKPAGRQASPISAFMAMGILAACALVGAAILALALYLENPWIAPPILALLAAGGITFYALSLTRSERLALDHREALSEELCKI